jgi:uncharacterized membrane protein YhaH (DUF805 family)
MFKAYKRYFDFEGRSNRAEYWLFALLCIIVAAVYWILVVAVVRPQGGMNAAGAVLMGLYGLFGLASLIPSLSVSIRRLHDTNRSGWFILLPLIPIVGAVVYFVFTVLPGTKGPNKYGPDPLGKPETDVFS